MLYLPGEEKAEQDQHQEWVWSPAGDECLPVASAWQVAFLCCGAVRRPVPFQGRTHTTVGLAGCYICTHLKQKQKTILRVETGKDIPTQGGEPHTGLVGSFSLGKGVFQAQGPFLGD